MRSAILATLVASVAAKRFNEVVKPAVPLTPNVKSPLPHTYVACVPAAQPVATAERVARWRIACAALTADAGPLSSVPASFPTTGGGETSMVKTTFLEF
jgi:hypothetical protein